MKNKDVLTPFSAPETIPGVSPELQALLPGQCLPVSVYDRGGSATILLSQDRETVLKVVNFRSAPASTVGVQLQPDLLGRRLLFEAYREKVLHAQGLPRMVRRPLVPYSVVSEGVGSVIAMRYEGRTLQDQAPRISERKFFEGSGQKGLRKSALQIISAVGELHQRGVVHRDIKPENVVGSVRGVLRLIDFGTIALSDERPYWDDPGNLRGKLEPFRCPKNGWFSAEGASTPGYFPPELLDVFGSEEPRLYHDIYPLAIAILTLLQGEPPFPREEGEDSAVYLKRASRKMIGYVSTREDLPPSIRVVITRMLSEKGEDRPDIEEVRHSFRTVRDDGGSIAVPVKKPLVLV